MVSWKNEGPLPSNNLVMKDLMASWGRNFHGQKMGYSYALEATNIYIK
jgi:hypothetical protein